MYTFYADIYYEGVITEATSRILEHDDLYFSVAEQKYLFLST